MCERHFPVAQDGARFNRLHLQYTVQHVQGKYMNKTNLTQTNVAQRWICWWEERLILFVNSHDTGVITTQDFFKHGSNMSESPSYFCVCVAHLEVASVLSRKKGNVAHFVPRRCLNMAKRFHLLCDYLKTEPNVVQRLDLKHMPPLNAAGKSIFMRSVPLFLLPRPSVAWQVPDQWHHALNL